MLLALARMLAVFMTGSFAVNAQAADWPTYHGNNLRTGVASSPRLGQLTRAWSAKVDSQVYASPLIAGGRVIVATENNSLYAFDSSGKQLWRRHIGSPVSGNSLPCGNIDPSGITGTPAIDTRSGTVYAVANLSGFHHQLVAVNIKNGKVRWRKGIDGKGSVPRVEQERGALLISHGRVYVPFGGLFGDCGPFRGFIVSRTLHGKGLRTYRNPAPEAGIWTPAGPAADGKGNIFATTGNGGGTPQNFQFSNSVIRLTPTLRRTAFWAPTDWQELSRTDTDVSALGPTLLSGGYVMQVGKNGVAYLLAPKLGGIGGEVFKQHICSGGFGGTASQAPFVYVPCTDGLYALRVQGTRFSVAWRAGGNAGPPIVAGGAVWSIGRGSGVLHAYDPSSGHEITSADLGDSISFPTPAAAGSLLVAPAGAGVVAFRGV